jgi:hypothetical protein
LATITSILVNLNPIFTTAVTHFATKPGAATKVKAQIKTRAESKQRLKYDAPPGEKNPSTPPLGGAGS